MLCAERRELGFRRNKAWGIALGRDCDSNFAEEGGLLCGRLLAHVAWVRLLARPLISFSMTIQDRLCWIFLGFGFAQKRWFWEAPPSRDFHSSFTREPLSYLGGGLAVGIALNHFPSSWSCPSSLDSLQILILTLTLTLNINHRILFLCEKAF